LAANASSYQATGLTPNTAYSVSVRAYHNSRGESAASATSETVYTLANAPTTLTSTAQTATAITLSWNANSNAVGTEYYIENTTASTNSGLITTNTWTSSGLTCNTSYTFKVKAKNGDDIDTTWSDNLVVSTATCPVDEIIGGGGAALPAAVGEGKISEAINMGQVGNIGSLNNSGTNVLGYINSTANFSATVSNHNNKIAQEHSFKIIDLDLLNNIITIQINSIPQIITLKLDENKMVDLDYDGIKDIEIKFENVLVNRAEITIATILDESQIKQSNLIKYQNSPKVYLLENNKKRWIVDAETFISLGYKWSDIQITTTIYADGENLASAKNKYIFKNFLKLGQASEEVRQLQVKLKTLGYFTYPQTTGFFGPATQTAVKAFQKANNIDQLGYVGPGTRAALNK
jgi:chitodextrinase